MQQDPGYSIALQYFEQVSTKLKQIQSLRNDLDSISISDETVQTLETQIRAIKDKRSSEIQRITNDSNTKAEIKKTQEITQIKNTIQQVNDQKQAMEAIISKLQKEINDSESQISKLNEAEKANSDEYDARNTEIEAKLKTITQQLDNLHSQDTSAQVHEIESKLSSINNAIRQKESHCLLLQQELNEDKTKQNLETEIKTIETRKNEIIENISKLPTINEWNEAQTELRIKSTANKETSISEITNIKNNIQMIKQRNEQMANEIAKDEQINMQLKQTLEHINEQKDLIIVKNDEETIIDIMKQQKLEMNEMITTKETTLQELRNEGVTLEERILQLKKEKEEILNCVSTENNKKGKSYRKNRKTKIEKRFLKCVKVVTNNSVVMTVVVVYLVLVHLILFIK
ncbi:hypothetical protein GPJ56_001318 [Histomonas meleagridis]|uniref:uncharacterized protein n=1 Tax=Histomonas meleagridis TaxID=135588 RepID=UPI00355AAF1F|nr:hypothetical protein GPJ56_001318 [Histomonas meleagridis]KAH0805075.1 hypothetical protein GO595_002020 [Histomonas meleagridis]